MNTISSSIGLGTAIIGRPLYINIRKKASESLPLEDFCKNSWHTLDRAYALGIRYFDTAPGYGLAEELLIDWILSKNDPTIEIATKWGYTYLANYDDKATEHESKEHTLSKLNEQWQRSKQLLPHLKIYQIHSATFESGVLENKAVLQRLFEIKQEHKIAIGITTTGTNQVDVLKKATEIEISGTPLFDTYQITYNILEQSIAKILQEKNIKVIVKEAMANGRLFPSQQYPQYKNVYQMLLKLSKKYKVGVDAIALRFCIDTLQPFKVLSGASNQTQVTENLKVLQFQLKPDEIKALQALASDPKNYWLERKKLPWN